MPSELIELETRLMELSHRIETIISRGCRSIEDASVIASLTDRPEMFSDYDLQSARHFRRALNAAFDWR